MAKKKQVQVLFIETFKGAKFLFRTDKPYEQELLSLFSGLIEKYPLGSIATISKRLMDEDKYVEMTKAKIENGFIHTDSKLTYTRGSSNGEG